MENNLIIFLTLASENPTTIKHTWYLTSSSEKSSDSEDLIGGGS